MTEEKLLHHNLIDFKFVRSSFSRRLSAVGALSARLTPVVLFLSGRYWFHYT